MSNQKLMIVEDEGLVALAIQRALERLGYEVVATTASGNEAFRLASETAPDLILMDIRLKGEVDGIEVADRIRQTHKIPVVYLTAHSDEKTLERAKPTEPFGYIVKPFDEKSLYSTVEIALFKAKLQTELVRTKERLATILRSLQETVIVTDLKGRIQYFNPSAERLTGIEFEKAIDENLFQTVRFRTRDNKDDVNLPASKIIMEGESEVRVEYILVRPEGSEIPVDITIAGVRNEKNIVIGLVVTIREVGSKKDAE